METRQREQTEAQTVSDNDLPASLIDGECPMCGSENIRSGADVMNKEGLRGGNRIPIDIQFAVPVDNYICIGCGYVESYITDRTILTRIEKQWQRVTPTENKDNA